MFSCFFFFVCLLRSLGLLGDKKFCFEVEMITAQRQFRQTNRRLCRPSGRLLLSAALLGENPWLIPAEKSKAQTVALRRQPRCGAPHGGHV